MRADKNRHNSNLDPITTWKKMPFKAKTFLIIGEVLVLAAFISADFRAWLNGILSRFF